MKKIITLFFLNILLNTSSFADISCENELESFSLISNKKQLTLIIKNKNTNSIYVLAQTLLGIKLKSPLNGFIQITKPVETFGNFSERISSSGLHLVLCTSAMPGTIVEIGDNQSMAQWTKGPAVHFEVSQIRVENAKNEANLIKVEINFYKYGNFTTEYSTSDCH